MCVVEYLFRLMGRQCEFCGATFSIATVDDNLAPQCAEKRDQSGQRLIGKAKKGGRMGNDNLKIYVYIQLYWSVLMCKIS